MEKKSLDDFLKLKILYNAEEEIHSHQDIELIYVLEGEADLSLEEKVYRLKGEDIMLVNSGKKHGIHRVPGAKKQGLLCSIQISWSFLCRHTGNTCMLFWCSSQEDMENNNYDVLREVLKNIVVDYANSRNDQYFYRHGLYFQLLHLLTGFFVLSGEMAEMEQGENGSQDHMGKMAAYLEQYYDQDISLSELAEYMNLSASYISRYFKKRMGMNFVEYLYKIRMEHAVEMLVSSDKPITSVALDNGFPNLAAFHKAFKKKYAMTPSEYRAERQKELEETRKEKEKEEERTWTILQDYLHISDLKESLESAEKEDCITADVRKYKKYTKIWSRAMNLGPAEAILNSDLQKAILYGKRYLGFECGRLWSLFSPNMLIVGGENRGTGRFHRLDRVLGFLVENDIIPIIEFGEKQNRIQKSIREYVRESDNVSEFQNYEEFLETVEAMMKHLASYYTEQRVNKWYFEIWDDKRIEVYPDKQPYLTLFTDIYRIVKKYAPKAKVGGAGNYLGWSHKHTEESVLRWIDHGVYPDYMTFTYCPYAMGELQKERMSKRKSDEDDLLHSVEDLKRILKQYGFPKMDIYISEWNMTSSSRNYFNDSLWKACYITKCCFNTLGKIDALVYSQLQDGTTDYYDNQNLLNGSGGLLTRDSIQKPAFMAIRLLRHLQKYLVSVGENFIITRDKYGKVTIVIHNFIKRNYLYFMKEEYENTLQEHYTYFEHQNKRTFYFELHGLLKDTAYDLMHHVVNRKAGSIMDEWAAFGFKENLQPENVEYLRHISIPRLFSVTKQTTADVLSFSVELEPLEVRCISIKPSGG